MSLINATAIPSGATDYEIPYAARFNGTNTKLTRTPSTTGNRRMLTFSAWIKQGDVGTSINGDAFFSAGVNGDKFAYQSGQLFRTTGYKNSAYWGMRDWDGIQRDASGWKHIVLRFDTAQGTEANRSRLFINGVEATQNYKYYDIVQNYEMRYNHTADAHWIGAMNNGSYFNGYMAEVHWIDGAIVSPNAFGEYGDYGEWKPKEYVVADYAAYGTNGYYLNFADASHFGKDVSGNGNNWTDTGFDTGDQVVDSPTNNFCTWNPVSTRASYLGALTEGNLRYNPAGDTMPATEGMKGTLAVNSGKWYFEVCRVDTGNGYHTSISGFVNGVKKSFKLYSGNYFYSPEIAGGYDTIGSTSPGTDGEISGCAFDLENNKIWFAVNGTWTQSGNPATNSGGFALTAGLTEVSIYTEHPNGSYTGDDITNCGQDSSFAGNKTAQGNQDVNGIGDFYYEPPNGFLSLCSKSLPEPTVVPSEHFNTVLYSGTGGTYPSTTQSVTNVGFEPSWTWIKIRTQAYQHFIYDAVRGATKVIYSDSTIGEATGNQMTSFNSDGFTVANISTGVATNASGESFVAWNWKANGSGSSNTNGSINTTNTSANVESGFSISTYIGTGSAATIGHGLSSAPDMIIVKRRDGTGEWEVYHSGNTSEPETEHIRLSGTAATSDNANYWNDTAPTPSVFTVGTDSYVNASGGTYVAYCFHSVEGYSAAGKYSGNGSTDGSFIFTGFRPAWLLVKRTDDNGNWYTWDSKRASYNPIGNRLYMDGTGAEATTPLAVDFTSNGFKWRDTNGGWNTSGDYIYLCFAETPFKYANSR